MVQTDHKSNQNKPIKQNVSPTPTIAVIDIERTRSKSGRNCPRIGCVEQSTVNRNLQYIKHEQKSK